MESSSVVYSAEVERGEEVGRSKVQMEGQMFCSIVNHADDVENLAQEEVDLAEDQQELEDMLAKVEFLCRKTMEVELSFSVLSAAPFEI